MTLEYPCTYVLAWVLLPNSVFANVVNVTSEMQLWASRLDASDFYQVGNFPLSLANKQACRSRNVSVPKEQLVVLMPKDCVPAASVGKCSSPSLSMSKMSPADPLLSVLGRMGSDQVLAPAASRCSLRDACSHVNLSIQFYFVFLCPNFKGKKRSKV